MLFGKKYDTCLLLILNIDKEYKDNIISFLESMPKELFEQIQNDINNIKETTNNVNSTLEVSIKINDNESFVYYLDSDTINITKIIDNNSNEVEKFSINFIDFNNLNSYTFDCGVMVCDDKDNYKLYKFSKYLNVYRISCYDKKNNIENISYEFFQDIPDDLNLVNINNFIRVRTKNEE